MLAFCYVVIFLIWICVCLLHFTCLFKAIRILTGASVYVRIFFSLHFCSRWQCDGHVCMCVSVTVQGTLFMLVLHINVFFCCFCFCVQFFLSRALVWCGVFIFFLHSFEMRVYVSVGISLASEREPYAMYYTRLYIRYYISFLQMSLFVCPCVCSSYIKEMCCCCCCCYCCFFRSFTTCAYYYHHYLNLLLLLLS